MTVTDRRARRKADTRRAIGAAALPLFLERGFDAVTLADIAARADVAVKTIHNHFGSKEDIFFDDEPRMLDSIGRAMDAPRDAGRLALDPLVRLVSDNRIPVEGSGWAYLEDPSTRAVTEQFLTAVEQSKTLTARWFVMIDRMRARIEAALADAGVGGDDDRRLLAAMLTAVIAESGRGVRHELMAGAPAEHVRARVAGTVRAGMARVAAAFPDLVCLGAPTLARS